jgi:uncharacterized protein (TIGR03435 family)
MMKASLRTAVAAMFYIAVAAQAADTPRFEAADIHASVLTANIRSNFMQGPFVGGGRFEIRKATIVDLIRVGWSVQPDKIVGGPGWTGIDKFDILAKAPAGATSADLRLMLQNLLADRFGLKVHNDVKPMPTFALVVAEGKKLHLKEANGEGSPGCKGQDSGPSQGGGRLMMSGPDGVVTTFSLLPGNLVQFLCRNLSMAAFAAQLTGMIGANTGPNPVSDDTGLKGTWDFDLKYSFNLGGPLALTAGAERISFGEALEKQLGLKLEKREVPMPVTVIDAVNQPTPNPPGMTLNLPALPTEFEVAVIKPTPPDFRFGNFRPQRGGRVNIEGMSLKNLIQQAWNLLSQDLIVGAPKFAESDRYDITAEAPTYGPDPGASPGSAPGPADTPRFQTIDQDSINVMLRNLLIERFKIQYHTEERPSTAFVLTALKPKMKKADPANRTGYHEGPGADGKDPRIANPAAGRLVACENMTMKQLAQNLPMMAGGYIQGATVYDETGIEGAFDFTLSFSGAGMVGAPGRGGRGGGDGAPGGLPEAADPNGAISLFEALEKQLGLKLERTKRPAQVLVIDHIEPKPIEN